MPRQITKRSIVVGERKTSVSLETEFFEALKNIAHRERKPLSALVREIDTSRPYGANLSSAIRLYVLADLQQRLEA
ncbi:ribbon-helix-helix domain-containing protein [Ancylobacter sp. Lp-2]|uniref:ribbon-helix-helix domain-containing protein n=1 Tax=Ancylobacter sp. Lp-2 TaxID=2881339 RepID=UPI001E4B7026|nr:ribbon-helix-helix domain-containing protein [Ancylobacter sp. Lp-2]MCB4771817.1 ribbon-helix-helix domain-containing protein [Ancylobacter sp. Lp-2]